MPQISVIIPLLNKGVHVKRALDSVLGQTVQDFEIIVVDGGSTDNGPDVVKSYIDDRITFMRQEGKGVSAARNQGVRISRGELITFLDADDEWMELHLETLLRLREKYPEAGAYTTAYKIMLQDGTLRWAQYESIPPAPWEGLIPNYFRSAALGEYPVWTSVVCIPRPVFMKFSGFPEDSSYGEDGDLFGKIALQYPIAFSWYLGGIYHWGAVNRICDNLISLDEEPFVRTAKAAMINGLVPPDIMGDLNEYIANKEINRAKRHVDAGRPKEARRILAENKTQYQRKRVFFMKLKSMLPYNVYKKLRMVKRSSF